MALPVPKNVKEDKRQSSQDPEEPSSQANVNTTAHDMEEEYHTSSSEQENPEDLEFNTSLQPRAPLLPAEVLKPLPSPTRSLQDIPLERMTRKQKRAERNRSRQAKKAVWDQLRAEAKGSGVLEAGKVAQLKRGAGKSKEKVRSGRVEKAGGKKTKAKSKVSGRQEMLEDRKRQIRSTGEGRKGKRAKTGSKR
ncbi:uncharacterized protein LTR77_009664 [Saxophila tyrrhenica]|uniref:Ribosome biogenesis regulatory protein n=1 Tax=Saxophila tyrrhenica TaxID=1690608 RepID=A0AAV9NXK4_9PEZI|nr:hypothetical protein LTR77_009664 [Saxophila tyrrhenica]